jgi:hypothetical protein
VKAFFKGENVEFKGPEQVLRQAYEILSVPIVKISSIHSMIGGDHGVGDTPHENHAEAANIVGLCTRTLSDFHMAYVRIQFGRDSSGLALLTPQVIASVGTGLHSRRGIEKIIRMYCGEPGNWREIKKEMSCGLVRAVVLKSRVYEAMDSIHARSMRDFWDAMILRSPIVDVYSSVSTIRDKISGSVCSFQKM